MHSVVRIPVSVAPALSVTTERRSAWRKPNDDAGASFLGAPLIHRVTALCPLLHVPAAPYEPPAMIAAPAFQINNAGPQP